MSYFGFYNTCFEKKIIVIMGVDGGQWSNDAEFETFKQMVSELQNDSRQFEPDQLKRLYETHQGNIRLAFRSLYDLL